MWRIPELAVKTKPRYMRMEKRYLLVFRGFHFRGIPGWFSSRYHISLALPSRLVHFTVLE